MRTATFNSVARPLPPSRPAGFIGYGEPAGRWVLAATVLGSSVGFLDATVVNIALPSIGRDLGSTVTGLTWTVNAYTLTLAAFVLTELRAHDWDGVMLDDTLTALSHPTVDDLTPTQIPDDAAMQDATESFLRAVGPRLQAAGYLAVPNLTVDPDGWDEVMPRWTPWVSGWENEFFVKFGADADPRFVGDAWESRLAMTAWALNTEGGVSVPFSRLSSLVLDPKQRATS